MTFPNYPGQIPQGGYPAQQPAYPPQPGYPPQQQPQYQQPPAGPWHTQQYQPQPPQPELPRGTLKDFMDQPASGGGPSLTFPHPGTTYSGTVVRNVTDADIQVQTDMITGAVQTYNDKRPKLVMKIPLAVQPSAQFPEGTAVWYVKGNDRAELTRAMEEAGVETDPATGRLYPPRAGDMLTVTYTHDQPGRRGMNPTKVKRVQYAKGNGQAPVIAAPQAEAPVQQPQYQQPAQAWGNTYPGQPAPQYAAPGTAYQGMPAVMNYQAQVPQYQGSNGNPAVPQYPDQAQNYQQATGQQMPPQGAAWDPSAQAFPPGTFQQAPPGPQPGPAAPPAPTGPTPGAAPTGPAFPSNDPPPNWPADVPFIPGLTVEQARVAATLHHPSAQ